MPVIERIQILVYSFAITSGIAFGVVQPEISAMPGEAVWPVLGLLLYVTLVHTPLRHVRDSFRDVRFLACPARTGSFRSHEWAVELALKCYATSCCGTTPNTRMEA
jgi:hypothetical protein